MKRKYPSPRKQAVGLCILAALAPSAHAQIQTAGDLLIDLNFTTLTPGDLTFVANPGTAAGGFEAIGAAGTIPKVQTVPNSTVKALSFDGSDFMVSVTEQTPLGGTPSRLDAPAQLAGFQPVRSVEAWVYNNAPLDEETVLAWGKRGGGDGTNFSCLYGSNTTWGALGQWGAPDLPWGTLPPSGTWHHVTWVHTGPGDGGAIPPNTTFLYVDGVLNNQEDAGALTTHLTPILLGSQWEGDGVTPTVPLRGSMYLGKVRIHSGVLSDANVLNNYNFEKAGFPATAASATLASGPVHRWSFGEAAGTKVTDSVGAYHGVVKGAGSTWSGDGTQLDLGPGGGSGAAAYVDLPNRLISRNAPELGGGGEITIEMWMTNTGAQNWARFFDFGSTAGGELFGPGGGGEGLDYLTLTASVGTDAARSLLSLRSHDPLGNGPLGAGGQDAQQESNYPSADFSPERHMAVVWKDGKFLEVYENGVPFREVRVSDVKMVQINDVNCWLGRSNWTGDANLAGTINEFRIYDRALTPAELLKNEADGPAAALPPPLDQDGDGLPDWFERLYASPNINYTVPGAPSQATLNGDTDSLTNLQEYQNGTNPIVSDTDADGLDDGQEITRGTNPLVTDTDGDGLSDGAEVNTHLSSPLLTDTDSDGYTDSQEVAGGSNPSNPTSIPVVFLAARYSFNSGAGPATGGAVVVDSVSGLNGYVRGEDATWTGSALQLPGNTGLTASYVDLPNNMMSRFAKARGGRGAVTMEGWVTVNTRTAGGAGWQRILDFGSSAPGGSLGEIFGPGRTIFGDTAGQDYFFLSGARGDDINLRRVDWTNNDAFGGAGSAFGADTNAAAGTIDAEFHFVVTYDESSGLLKYYENGAEIASVPGTLKLDALNDVNCWLGRSNWTADGALQGEFNEFRIYAGSFSAADVVKSMNKGPNATAQGSNPATDITTLKVLNANGWPEWWIDRNPGLPATGSDSDGDGLTALAELGRGSDPTKADTDGDGLSDAAESNSGIFAGPTATGTNPAMVDTDSDGLKDDAEVAATSNPFDQDTDDDLAFDGSDALPVSTAASSLNPAHKWTFDNLGFESVPDGTLSPDVVGGEAFPAVIRGLNASSDGASVILGGGNNNNDSAYVDLPNGLISTQSRITMAGWVTVNAITNWSRIVDFGASNGVEVPPAGIGNGSSYLFYSASNGTNASEQRLAIKNEPGGESLYNHGFSTITGQESFFAFTIDSTSGDRSVYTLYRDGQWGVRLGGATHTLSEVRDVNNWLGRSQFGGDPQLNGAFNEFRIYNGVLNEKAIRDLHATGPNDILDLINTVRSGNQLLITFESRDILSYTLESSPDLITWSPVTTGIPGETGASSTTTSAPIGTGRLFFRVRLDD